MTLFPLQHGNVRVAHIIPNATATLHTNLTNQNVCCPHSIAYCRVRKLQHSWRKMPSVAKLFFSVGRILGDSDVATAM